MGGQFLQIVSNNSLSLFLWRLCRDKPLGAVGALVCIIFIFSGLFADWIAPFDYNEMNPQDRLQSPSFAYFFGTDQIGRDVFSRIVYGARTSMVIGFAVALLSILISIFLGVLSGYFGGKLDMVLQRLVDAWMSFPDLVVVIVAVSVLGPGKIQIILILSLLYGIAGSRIIRGAVMGVRENDYVKAADSIGVTTTMIMIRHIIPNILAPVSVLFTTRLAATILVEAALSFLGLGVPPPEPSWGSMLSFEGRSYMFQAPWLAIIPGIVITIVVYNINMFGDAIRDLLDPRMRGSGRRQLISQ
ncbi:MAG: ABC transporter permease [Proteobacteria bacterium]|nr:ABC transporter permease [Pseudomonadota bacterium]